MSRNARIFLTLWILLAFFADPLLEISTVRSLYLARAIVEDHSFAVNRFAHASRGDLAIHDGRLYSGALPGLGLAITPIAALAHTLDPFIPLSPNMTLQLLSILLFNIPLAAGGAIILGRLLSKNDAPPSNIGRLIALTALFGTPLFFFTVKFMEYPLCFFLQVLLANLLTKENFDALPMRSAGAGAILGISFLTNDLFFLINLSFILTALPISSAGIFVRRWSLILLGALPGVLARMGYMKSAFGSYTATPYNFSAWSGTIADAYAKYSGPTEIFAATLNQSPEILLGITLGERGLFLFAPICLLLLPALRRTTSFSRLEIASGSAVLVAVLFHIFLIDGFWRSGASWGPRYLLFALVPITILLRRGAMAVSAKIVLPLATGSILLTFIGVQYGYSDNPFQTIGLFLLGGPTSPLIRYAWLYWPIIPTPERIALVMEETPLITSYYAFTHPSSFSVYLLLFLVLAAIWLPVWREKFRAR